MRKNPPRHARISVKMPKGERPSVHNAKRGAWNDHVQKPARSVDPAYDTGPAAPFGQPVKRTW